MSNRFRPSLWWNANVNWSFPNQFRPRRESGHPEAKGVIAPDRLGESQEIGVGPFVQVGIKRPLELGDRNALKVDRVHRIASLRLQDDSPLPVIFSDFRPLAGAGVDADEEDVVFLGLGPILGSGPGPLVGAPLEEVGDLLTPDVSKVVGEIGRAPDHPGLQVLPDVDAILASPLFKEGMVGGMSV